MDDIARAQRGEDARVGGCVMVAASVPAEMPKVLALVVGGGRLRGHALHGRQQEVGGGAALAVTQPAPSPARSARVVVVALGVGARAGRGVCRAEG